jgi:putative spermidine/putrescine transport system permease protein
LNSEGVAVALLQGKPAWRQPAQVLGLVGPVTFYVVICMLVPLAILFRYSLNRFIPGQFMVEALTLENYAKFVSDPYYTSVLWRTLRVALVTTAICLLMGFPLAYVLARTRHRCKNVLILLVVLPLFVGNAVRAARRAGWWHSAAGGC